MDPLAVAHRHVFSLKPGQSRLYPGADRGPHRQKAGLHRPGIDAAGRVGHPQDREREGMNTMSPALLISLMATLFCALALIPVFLLMRSSHESKRLMDVTHAPLRLQDGAAEAGN